MLPRIRSLFWTQFRTDSTEIAGSILCFQNWRSSTPHAPKTILVLKCIAVLSEFIRDHTGRCDSSCYVGAATLSHFVLSKHIHKLKGMTEKLQHRVEPCGKRPRMHANFTLTHTHRKRQNLGVSPNGWNCRWKASANTRPNHGQSRTLPVPPLQTSELLDTLEGQTLKFSGSEWGLEDKPQFL